MHSFISPIINYYTLCHAKKIFKQEVLLLMSVLEDGYKQTEVARYLEV